MNSVLRAIAVVGAVVGAVVCAQAVAQREVNTDPENTVAAQTPPDGLPAIERVAPLQADYSFEALLVFPAIQPPDVVRGLIEDSGGTILTGLEDQTFWCLFPAGTSLDAFKSGGVIVVTAGTSDEVVRNIAEPTSAALAHKFLLATGPGGRQAHAADDSEHPLINDAWDPGGGPRDGSTNEMTGTTTVAVMFVESNGTIDSNPYTWTAASENAILADVFSALSWWAARAAERGCTASFPNIVAYRGTNPAVRQGYEPILHRSSDAPLWINAIMTNLGYTSGDHLARVSAFNTWLRSTYGTTRAYTAFVAYNPSPAPDHFTDGYAAWAYRGGPYAQLLYRSFTWPFAQVFAHETGHIYWACDEYYQAGYGGCTSCGECRNGVNNGNCDYCSPNPVACMMKGNTWNLCTYTPGHVGWTLGACCYASGSCAVTLQAACTGTWQGACTTCSPNPCPQPQGACCQASGACSVTTQAACSGTWQGAGTTCSPNPCPQPQGACCYASGSCAVTTQAACSGTWRGAGTTCSPNPCPQPQGACCQANGACSVTAQATCSGTWQGAGTTCSPNPCSQPGACCRRDGTCYLSTVTAPGNCASGDKYQGNDTTCTPMNPCVWCDLTGATPGSPPDGVVDVYDYMYIHAGMGYCNPHPKYVQYQAADIDGDGCITLVDYQDWLMCFSMANDQDLVPTPKKPELSEVPLPAEASDGAPGAGGRLVGATHR